MASAIGKTSDTVSSFLGISGDGPLFPSYMTLMTATILLCCRPKSMNHVGIKGVRYLFQTGTVLILETLRGRQAESAPSQGAHRRVFTDSAGRECPKCPYDFSLSGTLGRAWGGRVSNPPPTWINPWDGPVHMVPHHAWVGLGDSGTRRRGRKGDACVAPTRGLDGWLPGIGLTNEAGKEYNAISLSGHDLRHIACRLKAYLAPGERQSASKQRRAACRLGNIAQNLLGACRREGCGGNLAALENIKNGRTSGYWGRRVPCGGKRP
jgi:hypothetical protein